MENEQLKTCVKCFEEAQKVDKYGRCLDCHNYCEKAVRITKQGEGMDLISFQKLVAKNYKLA